MEHLSNVCITLTFNLFVLLVPATELLALGSWDIGIVGTIHYWRNHTLEKAGEIKEVSKKAETGTMIEAEKQK